MDRLGLPLGIGAGRLLQAALALLLGAAPLRAASVAFLYVEPSHGSAGGGHFGIQLDGDVYHFQNVDGWLRLQRWEADFFRYAYSVRENRTIHVAKVEVDEEGSEALRQRFSRRYGVERRHEAVHASLVRDRQLIELLRAREQADAEGRLPFPLAGAGFFEPGPADATLRRLRTRVEATYGPTYLARRIAALRAELGAMAPAAARAGLFHAAAGGIPAAGSLFSERFSDATLKLLALEALHGGARLREGLLRELPAAGAGLDAAERRALARFAGALEGRLLELLESPRPDWGFPVLLGMARLVALEASLRSGRLTVLDAFPYAAAELGPSSVRERRVFFEELREREELSLRQSRDRLVSSRLVAEPEYQQLEEAANRFVELDGALAGGVLRLSGRRLIPEGPLPAAGSLLPRAEGAELEELAAEARRAEAAFLRVGERLYGYDLWRRNCVTEIFRTLEAEFPAAESVERLGGHLDPDGFLHFVPAAAFGAVVERYRVSELGEIPSFRRTRLEAMRAREGPLRTHLRESNTLSSSLYRGDEGAPAFLFFTEDLVWLRPVYGAFNLLAGLAQMTWGAAIVPFDRGAELTAGAEGVVFSVPELVFVSLRKGSMAYAPSEEPRTQLRVLETH